jgi:hypothetical protein
MARTRARAAAAAASASAASASACSICVRSSLDSVSEALARTPVVTGSPLLADRFVVLPMTTSYRVAVD